MNEPQEIPEARAAANKVRDVLGISTTDFKFDAVFEIITEACREYAKRENTDLLLALSRIQRANPNRTTATELQSQIAEGAALRQQLSALQKENDDRRIRIMELERALDNMHFRAEKAEQRVDELRRTIGTDLMSGEVIKLEAELTTLRNDYALQAKKLINTGHELYRLRNDAKPLLAWMGAGPIAQQQLHDFLSRHPELKD
jgi:chromosome segregation ATPase